MIPSRGVIPVLLLLALVAFGSVIQAVRGSAAATQPAATATPAPTPETATDPAVLQSLAAVQRAYDAGNVQRLCRPGVLIDGAVIRQLHPRSGGCQSRLESLIDNVPSLRFKVQRVRLEADLATATVMTSAGTATRVDFVRRGTRWLLSFSDGADPLPALAGTA